MPRLNVNDNINSPKSTHYWMCRMKLLWSWPSRIFDRVHARDTKSTTTTILKSQLMTKFAIRNRYKAGSWEFFARSHATTQCVHTARLLRVCWILTPPFYMCDSFCMWLILYVTHSVRDLFYIYISLMPHIYIHIITNASYIYIYHSCLLHTSYHMYISLMPHTYIHIITNASYIHIYITHASYIHLNRAHVEAERGRQRMHRGRVGSRCVALSPAALPVQRRCDSLYMWFVLCDSFSRPLYM